MALHWSPPVALSKREEHIVRGCKKAKLFVFLRQYRHELFDEAFQAELAAIYPTRARGKEPVAPALLAMVTLLQAALGFSDEDAVEYAQFELRARHGSTPARANGRSRSQDPGLQRQGAASSVRRVTAVQLRVSLHCQSSPLPRRPWHDQPHP